MYPSVYITRKWPIGDISGGIMNSLATEYRNECARIDAHIHRHFGAAVPRFTRKARLSQTWDCLGHAIYNRFLLSRKGFSGFIETTKPGEVYRSFEPIIRNKA
jgi:hypothetical protein